MGAKRKLAAKSKQHANNNYDNVINIKSRANRSKRNQVVQYFQEIEIKNNTC